MPGAKARLDEPLTGLEGEHRVAPTVVRGEARLTIESAEEGVGLVANRRRLAQKVGGLAIPLAFGVFIAWIALKVIGDTRQYGSTAQTPWATRAILSSCVATTSSLRACASSS